MTTPTVTTTSRVDIWPAQVWWAGYCTGSVLPSGVELREDGRYRDPARPELGWAGSISGPLNTRILAVMRRWGTQA